MKLNKLLRIIVIEPEDSVAEYIKDIITNSNIIEFEIIRLTKIDELDFTPEKNSSDLLVINLELLTVNAAQALHKLKQSCPNIPIIALITQKNIASTTKIMQPGIEYFFLKETNEDLLFAKFIYIVIERTYLTLAINQLYIQRYNTAHDHLTGLPNKLYLYRSINYLIKHVEKNRGAFALALIDLDDFESVNYTVGYANGDAVLKTIAERLSLHISDDDLLVRVGGDEFMLVLNNIASGKEAEQKALALQKIIQEPMVINNSELTLSSTIGVTLYPYDAQTADDLMHNCEIIMHLLKKHNMGLSGLYKNIMNTNESTNIRLINDIKTGLKNNEFVLHFEPQIDFASKKIIGVESLLRWQHRSLGLLTPNKFLHFSEKAGFSVLLDTFVCRESCKWFSTLAKSLQESIMLTVNVAVDQISNDQFINNFINIITEFNLNPHHVEIEISEQIFETGIEYSKYQELSKNIVLGTIGKSLKKLKDLGVHISINDFGMGYSPINYLELLAIDSIKINGDCIKNLSYNTDAINLIKYMHTIASNLGLKLIAVGVENQQQAELLFSLGCQYMQGKCFYPALSSEEFLAIYTTK